MEFRPAYGFASVQRLAIGPGEKLDSGLWVLSRKLLVNEDVANPGEHETSVRGALVQHRICDP